MLPWAASNTLQAVGNSNVCIYDAFKAIAGYIGSFTTGNDYSTENASTVTNKLVRYA